MTSSWNPVKNHSHTKYKKWAYIILLCILFDGNLDSTGVSMGDWKPWSELWFVQASSWSNKSSPFYRKYLMTPTRAPSRPAFPWVETARPRNHRTEHPLIMTSPWPDTRQQRTWRSHELWIDVQAHNIAFHLLIVCVYEYTFISLFCICKSADHFSRGSWLLRQIN